jgi:hypothetical protein
MYLVPFDAVSPSMSPTSVARRAHAIDHSEVVLAEDQSPGDRDLLAVQQIRVESPGSGDGRRGARDRLRREKNGDGENESEQVDLQTISAR